MHLTTLDTRQKYAYKQSTLYVYTYACLQYMNVKLF